MESDAGDKAFGFSRRDFIKTAGLGIAAVSIPGLVMSANAGAASMTGVGHDEIETDVLVIGGGFAGIFAAMKAREKGVDVAVTDRYYGATHDRGFGASSKMPKTSLSM